MVSSATPPTCWLTSAAMGRLVSSKGGRGVFAVRRIAAGEVITVWGGEVVPGAALHGCPEHRRLALQIDEDLYMVSIREGPADWINHSCSPNAGMRGQITLVALRDIEPGQEICYDYAMTDGSPYDEFPCDCGMPECRHWISGHDWRRPELVERYAGYFSTYLQARIDRGEEARPGRGRTPSPLRKGGPRASAPVRGPADGPRPLDDERL